MKRLTELDENGNIRVKAWMHLPEAYGSDVEQRGIFEAEGVDATKEAVYPEWKRKLMQTFLGSRRG